MMPDLVWHENRDLLGHPASAVLSPDGTYRYLLTRTWGQQPFVTWVMLNPSTADAFASDPTCTRVERFSRRWGYGGLAVVNLYGLRSTDPAALTAHPDPVGPENDRIIAENSTSAQMVIAAWGAAFRHEDRPAKVAAIFAAAGRELYCLGITKGGCPRHPLYIRGDTMPVPYPLGASEAA